MPACFSPFSVPWLDDPPIDLGFVTPGGPLPLRISLEAFAAIFTPSEWTRRQERGRASDRLREIVEALPWRFCEAAPAPGEYPFQARLACHQLDLVACVEASGVLIVLP